MSILGRGLYKHAVQERGDVAEDGHDGVHVILAQTLLAVVWAHAARCWVTTGGWDAICDKSHVRQMASMSTGEECVLCTCVLFEVRASQVNFP